MEICFGYNRLIISPQISVHPGLLHPVAERESDWLLPGLLDWLSPINKLHKFMTQRQHRSEAKNRNGKVVHFD